MAPVYCASGRPMGEHRRTIPCRRRRIAQRQSNPTRFAAHRSAGAHSMHPGAADVHAAPDPGDRACAPAADAFGAAAPGLLHSAVGLGSLHRAARRHPFRIGQLLPHQRGGNPSGQRLSQRLGHLCGGNVAFALHAPETDADRSLLVRRLRRAAGDSFADHLSRWRDVGRARESCGPPSDGDHRRRRLV